jgi:AmmeMemoRadiSam system protein B
MDGLPAMKPKLRQVDVHSIQHEGQSLVLLRDPLQLRETQIAIPRPLAPLLALMDGTREAADLEAALQVRTGVRLKPGLLSKLLADLDEACLLDNERYMEVKAAALQVYREGPHRRLTVWGDSGSSVDQEHAEVLLQRYVDTLPPASRSPIAEPIRGLVSPHIDYQRGGPVYAQVWQAAARAVGDAELVLVLGTDHQGSDGAITLTRQSYATPWGVLPTENQVVEALSRALGHETVFAEELNHRSEHSIELAVGWLHFIRGGGPVPIVPILCGHFGGFIEGESDPASHQPFMTVVDVLRPVMAARRTLVVAAADLAHVGPAFGGAYGLDFVGRAKLRHADERLLETVYAGAPTAFFETLKAEGDRRNVCGLPPIYLTLRLLEGARGEAAGYALCPADPQGVSFVTIAGVILH